MGAAEPGPEVQGSHRPAQRPEGGGARWGARGRAGGRDVRAPRRVLVRASCPRRPRTS